MWALCPRDHGGHGATLDVRGISGRKSADRLADSRTDRRAPTGGASFHHIARRYASTLFQAISTLAFLIPMVACGQPESPVAEPAVLTITLSWNGDADLDLEAWSDTSIASDGTDSSANSAIGAGALMSGNIAMLADSRLAPVFRSVVDEVSGANGRTETLKLPLDSPDTLLIVVRFFSVGPSNSRRVQAFVHADGAAPPTETATAILDNDSADAWIPFAVVPAQGVVRRFAVLPDVPL